MKTVENCFSNSVFNKIKNQVFDNGTPWHFIKTTYNDSHLESIINNYSWVHSVMMNEQPTSHLFNNLYPELINLLVRNKEQFTKILRIRLGLITNTTQQFVNDAHVDLEFDHKVGLIYLNSSDAPTYIYQEQYDPNSKMNIFQYINNKYNGNLNILSISECKENKLVLFNGMNFHSSSTPTNVPRRIVINFNYI